MFNRMQFFLPFMLFLGSSFSLHGGLFDALKYLKNQNGVQLRKQESPKFEQNQEQRPAALSNHSADCYANSLLQAMANSQHMINYLKKIEDLAQKQQNSDIQRNPFNPLPKIGHLFKMSRIISKRGYIPFEPRIDENTARHGKKLYETLVAIRDDQKNASQLAQEYKDSVRMDWMPENPYGQHDVEEFLTRIILPRIKVQGLKNPFTFKTSDALECKACGGKRIRISVNDVIKVPILAEEKNKIYNIPESMDRTKSEEVIAKCEREQCKQNTKHTKELKMMAAPNMLFVQILRFNNNFGNTSKISRALDLQNEIYDRRLKAIIFHLGGTPNVGHYTAAINKDQNISFLTNDTQVTEYKRETIQDIMKGTRQGVEINTPYLMVYEKSHLD